MLLLIFCFFLFFFYYYFKVATIFLFCVKDLNLCSDTSLWNQWKWPNAFSLWSFLFCQKAVSGKCRCISVAWYSKLQEHLYSDEIIDHCGHIPVLEQGQVFKQEDWSFLTFPRLTRKWNTEVQTCLVYLGTKYQFFRFILHTRRRSFCNPKDDHWLKDSMTNPICHKTEIKF